MELIRFHGHQQMRYDTAQEENHEKAETVRRGI
jgi:hypothetical protein